MLRIAHTSETSSSPAFCPNAPCHRPGCSSLPVRAWFQQLASLASTSAMVGQTQLQQPQSLEEAAASPMASRRHLLLMCPPNSGGRITLCPRDPPQLEKHLSPLVPLASPRKLVSDTLDFFSYLPSSRDQQHSSSS